MSRKFNAGRQNDLLLNEKLHKLYTHLEFVSYNKGEVDSISMPMQTKQAAIPLGALWLQQPIYSSDPDTPMVYKLRAHKNPQAPNIDDRWPCLFEGYYHPASLKEVPKAPIHGQIFIDQNNKLKVYNSESDTWEDVFTL